MKLRLFCRVPFTVALVYMLLFPVFAFSEPPGKTLLVVAHPDDEYYFAATVYRMAVQLGGRVDEFVITDGEGGFRYSTLAEPYYKKPLTTETVGRKDLPAIRRKETINAGKVLGIKEHFFLDQKDDNFTMDADDGLKHGWDSGLITAKIAALIRAKHYKYIFSILPRSTTHGHHQEAAALAAIAIHSLPENLRPLLLGFDTDATEFIPTQKDRELQRWGSTYAYVFKRTTAFGFHQALTYQIVVNWMIAEHKSQGLLQTMCGKDPNEYMWVDFASIPQAQVAAGSLFRLLEFGSGHREGSQ